jgi:hypothetical protein
VAVFSLGLQQLLTVQVVPRASAVVPGAADAEPIVIVDDNFGRKTRFLGAVGYLGETLRMGPIQNFAKHFGGLPIQSQIRG